MKRKQLGLACAAGVLLIVLQGDIGDLASKTYIAAAKKDPVNDSLNDDSITKKIGVLPPGTASPFHSQIAKGAQDKGNELGYDVWIRAPAKEADFQQQILFMEQLIEQQVSAIAINAIDDKAVSMAIQKANQAHIPVLVYNSLTPVSAGRVTEYIGYDQRNGGKLAGEYAKKLLHQKGNILILLGVPGFHSQERSEGFKEALASCPDIRIVDEEEADWDREKAVQVTMQLLQNHPDVDLIFGVSDEMAIGASIAARSMGKHILTIGIDGNPVTLDEISKGNVTATLGVFPEQIGSAIITQIQKVLAGQIVPEAVEMPAVIVDKNNVIDYISGNLWRERQVQ